MGAVAAANESSFLAESSFIAAADAECASATLSWCARRRDGAAPSAQRGLSRVERVGAVGAVAVMSLRASLSARAQVRVTGQGHALTHVLHLMIYRRL